MLLTRDLSQRPEPYRGIQMRSKAERAVAEHLDALGIRSWEYEAPANVGGEVVRWYLPDFYIPAGFSGVVDSDEGPIRVDIPGASWIEVKPQSMLYDLQDRMRAPKRQTACIQISSDDLKRTGIEELWKPKRLAEHSGRPVLVVGEVGRSRTMSATMHSGCIWFRSDHPFVNFRTAVDDMRKRRERLEAERRHRERLEQQRIEREKRQRERDAELRSRWQQLRPVVSGARRTPAKFNGDCEACRASCTREHLVLCWTGGGKYVCLCHDCEQALQ